MSFKDYTIETFKGGADDGIVSQGGSPTGYFLRKYIQEATSFEPGKEAVSKASLGDLPLCGNITNVCGIYGQRFQ